MAVNKTINKRTNTHGAMRNCIEYVLRQDKTSELLTYGRYTDVVDELGFLGTETIQYYNQAFLILSYVNFRCFYDILYTEVLIWNFVY